MAIPELSTIAAVTLKSDLILLKFEKPADQSAAALERRAGYGQTYYDKFSHEENGMNDDGTEDREMVCYKNLEDVPSYYQAAVTKAVDKGALNGTGDGINVSEDLCRTLTVLDRLGKLD